MVSYESLSAPPVTKRRRHSLPFLNSKTEETNEKLSILKTQSNESKSIHREKGTKVSKLIEGWNALEAQEENEIVQSHRNQVKKKPKGPIKRKNAISIAIAKLGAEEERDPGAEKSPRLPEIVTRDYVVKLMNWYKDSGRMHIVDVMRVLVRVQPLFRKENNIIIIPKKPKITVVGDLHGQIDDLFYIFKMNGLPSENNPYLFNGDLVDRGSNSCEITMVIFLFKILYPDLIFVNRGNHEARDLNEWGGFESEVMMKYNVHVYNLFQEVFSSLPLAHIIQEKVYVVHGGLFHRLDVTFEEVQQENRFLENCPEKSLMEDMLWSDPRNEKGIHPSISRGSGICFGPDVTQEFLKNWNLDLIIRSHEVKDRGYEETHDDKVITVFTASNYCGAVGNQAAFIILSDDPNKPLYPVSFMATSRDIHNDFSDLVTTGGTPSLQLAHLLLQKLAPRIIDHRQELLDYYHDHDQSNSGYISSAHFNTGLCKILGIDLPYLFLQNFLGAPTIQDPSKDYQSFLEHFRPKLHRRKSSVKLLTSNITVDNDQVTSDIQAISEFIYDNRYSLRNLFNDLDIDDSGGICFQEFYEGFKLLNLQLPEQLDDSQLIQLWSDINISFPNIYRSYMDANKDDTLSFEEFFACFQVPIPEHTELPSSKLSHEDHYYLNLIDNKITRRSLSEEKYDIPRSNTPIEKLINKWEISCSNKPISQISKDTNTLLTRPRGQNITGFELPNSIRTRSRSAIDFTSFYQQKNEENDKQ